MPKLPSLQQLLHGFAAVIKRFPFEIFASVIGTVAAMILVERENVYTIDQIQIFTRILLCSILSLTLFLAVSVYVEQQKISWKKSWVLRIPAVLFIIALFFLLHPIDNTANIFRYGFLFVAFHLLVSFAPFIRTHKVSAFWEYNKRLFLRILTAGLYSSVLYAGLCIAIVSTNVLFDLELDGKIYAHLGAFIFGIFNTAFFLAGVPTNWNELEDQLSYPKGLKIFTQFVLIPLATIYLAILLTYEGKVIIQWSLPEGYVSSLVLGYAVYGILSILLIHPIRHDEGNKWIKTFSKLFYVLLIPLIILLSIAIWTRIQQYGITESRYIIIILSLWLMGVTAYFLFGKSQNIKIIPVSLCVLAMLCTWGPQSATSISLNSQMDRLIAFFEKHNAYKDGKMLPLDKAKKSNEGWEITTFIVERYGSSPFKEYLSVDVDSLTYPADTIKTNYNRTYQRQSIVRDYLGLKYEYANSNSFSYYSAQAVTLDSIPLSGFRYIMDMSYPANYNDTTYKWKADSTLLVFSQDDRLLEFDLQPVLQTIIRKKNISGYYYFKQSRLYCEDKTRKAKLVFRDITFVKEDGKVKIQTCRAYVLIK